MALSYANGYFALALDGYDCGIVQKVGGGGISMEVAKYAQADQYLVKNHGGNIKYEDINIQCGLSMGTQLKDWIYAALDSAHIYKSGAVQVMNFNREVVQEREFKNALITEVGFPAADAAAKDAAYLSVKWACETIRYKKGGKDKASKPVNPNQQKFKNENFRLTIDGLDTCSSKVSKVEALTVKVGVTHDKIGNARDHEMVPTAFTMPNLKITFAEAYVDEVAAYLETFVINGDNSIDKEKTFLLEFLDQTRQNVLLGIKGEGVGITNLTRAELSNNAEAIATCTAEFYCDKISVTEWNA